MSDSTFFNDNGITVTHSQVRTQAKTYSLKGTSFSKTRSTEHIEVHREETARRRRRLLKWGALAGLVAGIWAGFHYGASVQEYFQVTEERTISERAGQGIAFMLATGMYAIALVGVMLCVHVNRAYRMYHVYLNTGSGEKPIASSRNEAWITAIAAALDQAIARQSVAAMGSRSQN